MKRKIAVLLLLLSIPLVLASPAEGATFLKPAGGDLDSSLERQGCWSSYRFFMFDETEMNVKECLPSLQIHHAEGKFITTASWDGSVPDIQKCGLEWSMPLTAQIGHERLSYTLKSVWTDMTKLKNGKAEISLTRLSESSEKAKYRYVLRFPGLGAWASKDGMSAGVEHKPSAIEGLREYIVLSVNGATCSFKAGHVERTDGQKQPEKISFIEAQSAVPMAEEQASPLIMSIDVTLVETWSFEPAMALACSMGTAPTEPDIRMFGMANKREAVPGEEIEYTYFLFNAGMDEAASVKVTIPLSEGTSLVSGSINGSPGIATLIPSYKYLEVLSERQMEGSQDSKTRSFRWTPAGNLMPGETIKISFSVIIQQ